MGWIYNIVAISILYTITWLVCGCFYYWISKSNGDMDCMYHFNHYNDCLSCDDLDYKIDNGELFYENYTTNCTYNMLSSTRPNILHIKEFRHILNISDLTLATSENSVPPITCLDNLCIVGISSFLDAIIFSIDLQTTIGYGVRHLTPNCKSMLYIFIVQTILGTFLKGTLVGLMFLKISQPNNREKTIWFSKYACISKRNGVLIFNVRIMDVRVSSLVGLDIYGKFMTFNKNCLEQEPFNIGFIDYEDLDSHALGCPIVAKMTYSTALCIPAPL